MRNELRVFENELFKVAVKLEDGSILFDAENVSRCLGFTTVAKSGNVTIRWSRVNSYLPKSFPDIRKGDFIPESLVYKLAFKASNEVAESFQDWLAMDVIPTIRKTGGYVANEDLFLNTYLPYADETTRTLFKGTLETVRKQNELIQSQRKEIEKKENIIIALVDDVTLAEKRQILNRVVRSGGVSKTKDRWSELYKQFENKYHINIKLRMERYNEENKPKMKSKLDYIDKVMNKIPELYEIACKLYENDIKSLVNELYSLNNEE